MSSAGGLISTRLSRNTGTRTNTFRRKARRARSVREIGGGGSALDSAILFLGNFRPAGRERRQRADRCVQPRTVKALGGETRLLQQHGQVARSTLTEVVHQPLRLEVGVRTARPFHFLRQRVAGTQTARIELDRMPEIGDALIETAARRFRAGPEEMRSRRLTATAPPPAARRRRPARTRRAAGAPGRDWPTRPVRPERPRSLA